MVALSNGNGYVHKIRQALPSKYLWSKAFDVSILDHLAIISCYALGYWKTLPTCLSATSAIPSPSRFKLSPSWSCSHLEKPSSCHSSQNSGQHLSHSKDKIFTTAHPDCLISKPLSLLSNNSLPCSCHTGLFVPQILRLLTWGLCSSISSDGIVDHILITLFLVCLCLLSCKFHEAGT